MYFLCVFWSLLLQGAVWAVSVCADTVHVQLCQSLFPLVPQIRLWIKTLLVQKRLAEVVAMFVERQAEME